MSSRTDLTRTELKVIEQLSHGFTNDEIADKLSISAHTVKFHVANILCRLRAKNRCHAIAIYCRLIEPLLAVNAAEALLPTFNA